MRTTKVDSPAAACAAKDAKRRVSFTDLTESSAETSASSLLDSTLSQAQAPISSRNPPSPAPSRLANGVGGANGSIQQRRQLMQQPAIPSPLTMARRSELAEDSPLVVRGAVLKHCSRRWTLTPYPTDVHPGLLPRFYKLAWWAMQLPRSRWIRIRNWVTSTHSVTPTRSPISSRTGARSSQFAAVCRRRSS